MNPRPFRFGTMAMSADSKRDWADKARQIEDLGYSVLLVPDHVGSGDQWEPFQQFAPIAAAVAAANATTSLRVGGFVFSNVLRHPVLLAKEAATVDVLSDGRFELGIGAGWVPSEYHQIGLRFDSGGVRLNRLRESVQIIKQYFTGESFSFDGHHYRIENLAGYPLPVQQPHPPLLIGGSGKHMLSFAAREADTISLGPKALRGSEAMDLTDMGHYALTRKLTWIRQAAGDRFANIEISTLVYGVIVTDDRQQVRTAIAERMNATAQQLVETPFFLIGTVDQIVEDVLGFRERYGISYFSVFDAHKEAFAPVVARLRGE